MSLNPERQHDSDKTHYADPDTLATLARLERENADLRSDIERHVKIASEQATEMAALREDLADLERQACEELADLRSKLEAAQRDAERFLWMTADHDNADVRERVVNLCNRLPMMSTSAVRMYIDAAMQEGKP